MTLPITIPNTFANATGNLSLSLLDANFTTVANGINGIGNGTNTLTAPVISGGNIALTALGYVGAANTVIASNGTAWVATTSPQKVLQNVYAENTTWVGLATNIPLDNTIPQITEGNQILSANITPTSASSRIRIRTVIPISATTGQGIIGAVFSGSGANAITAIVGTATQSYLTNLVMEYEEAAANTSARTYTVRAGVQTGGGSAFINGSIYQQFMGGAMRCTIVVEEIQ